MGIGDWGLGIGPIPNPQSPIPNPQSPYLNIIKNIKNYFLIKNINFLLINNFYLVSIIILYI